MCGDVRKKDCPTPLLPEDRPGHRGADYKLLNTTLRAVAAALAAVGEGGDLQTRHAKPAIAVSRQRQDAGGWTGTLYTPPTASFSDLPISSYNTMNTIQSSRENGQGVSLSLKLAVPGEEEGEEEVLQRNSMLPHSACSSSFVLCLPLSLRVSRPH